MINHKFDNDFKPIKHPKNIKIAEIEADFFGLTQFLIFLIEKSHLTPISSI